LYILTNSFNGCPNLKKVTIISNNELIVATNSFPNCTSLSEFNFPTSATKITLYSNAFQGCTNLKSITLPASLDAIDANVFASSGVETFTFLGENPPTSVNATAFGTSPNGPPIQEIILEHPDADVTE